MVDPGAIAMWRFEQIAPFLDPALSETDRRTLFPQMGRTPVRWPSGEERPVARSTLYRWWLPWRREGLSGLRPHPRRAREGAGEARAEAIEAAVALLLERADRSLAFLLEDLRARYAGPESGPTR